MMIRFPGLKAAGDLVQVLEAGGRAGQRRALQRQPVQLVELLVQHLLDRPEVLLAVVARDLEHRLLRLLHQLARRRLVAQDALLDLVRALQQAPQQGVLAHDLRIAAGMAGGRYHAGQFVHSRRAADRLQLAHLAQAVGDCQDVNRLALVVQREHRFVDHAVALAVEVVRPQPLFDHQRVQRTIRQQDRAEDRLLRVEVVRRRDHARGGASCAVGLRDGAHELAECRSAPARSRGVFRNTREEKILRSCTNICSRQERRSKVARRAPPPRRYFLATTIVLIVAVTFSTTSTTTM